MEASRPTRGRSLFAHPLHGPLPALLILLTFGTGLIDAISIIGLGRVFVANMTGNIVFIGFALAEAPGYSLWGKFPHLTFVLSSVVPSTTAIQAEGMLTVRDRTRPIVFEAAASAAGDSEITVTSQLDVDRGDYDMNWNPLGASKMNNSVSVTAVFTRA